MADASPRSLPPGHPPLPADRIGVQLAEAVLPVPSIAELRRIGRLFGRPKDAERDALLASLLPRMVGARS